MSDNIDVVLCIPCIGVVHQIKVPVKPSVDVVIALIFDRYKLPGTSSQYKLFIVRNKVNCIELVGSINSIVFYENNFRRDLESIASPVTLYLSNSISIVGERQVLDDSSIFRRLFVDGDEYYRGTMFAWIEYAITVAKPRVRHDIFASFIACIDDNLNSSGASIHGAITSGRFRSLLSLAAGSTTLLVL